MNNLDEIKNFKTKFNATVQKTDCVHISLEEQDFNNLVAVWIYLETLLKADHISGALSWQIVNNYDAEIRLRNQNPTLKKAYENYQTLLHLSIN